MTIGHNSLDGKSLGSFIERVEALEAEKKDLAEDIKTVYLEAKVKGLDPKIMRKIVKMRAMDAEKRREEAELLDLYCVAIGLD